MKGNTAFLIFARMKLDILCFGAHPDDVELSCSGTIMKHIELGYEVGIIDLTQGELGTRGTVESRQKEAAAASRIMGISKRENLKLADGFFRKDTATLITVIEKIRQYCPEIILCNAEEDRHVDHGRAANLVEEATFLSGLSKIETQFSGKTQKPWRPRQVYHYMQDRRLEPNVVVDISPYFEKKMQCIQAYETQFFDPEAIEPKTPISGKDFLQFLEGRARDLGRSIGVEFAEAFTVRRSIGVANLMALS